MTILDLAFKINKVMRIDYYPTAKGRFECCFYNVYVVNKCLYSPIGTGKTANEAINDYSDKLSNQIIEFYDNYKVYKIRLRVEKLERIK